MVFAAHLFEPRDRHRIPPITLYQVLAASLARAAWAQCRCAHRLLAEGLMGICPRWAFAHAEMLAAARVARTLVTRQRRISLPASLPKAAIQAR